MRRHDTLGLKPSGQRNRLSSSSPALFKGSQQRLALVTEAKARELLALGDSGLLSQLSPADTVKPSGALFQKPSMGRILLPPGRVGHTAPVTQKIGVPVFATTHATILRASARECCAPCHCWCEENPLGRSTAPGRGAGWRVPGETR